MTSCIPATVAAFERGIRSRQDKIEQERERFMPTPHVVAMLLAHHHAQLFPIAMMVSEALQIGWAEIVVLHDLRDRAVNAPVNIAAVMELTKTEEGRARHIQAMGRLTVEIPHGFLVTYSIEIGHPAGPCRRLTMSTARENATPPVEAVMLVARELGFVGDASASHFWLEPACLFHREQGRERIANLVQPLSMTDAPGNA
jgi:hypothetical protein